MSTTARLSSPCSISYKGFLPWVVLALLASQEVALAKLSLSISPPLLEISLAPGGVKRFQIVIANEGEKDARVLLRFLSFGLSPEGEVTFLEESPYSLTPWMKTKEEEVFVLRAKEKREIPLEIRAPRNERGGRYGVVLFEALPVGTPSGMAVGIRMGTLILATFPRNSGPKGKIWNVQESGGKVVVEVENTGDVHFTITEAELVLKNDSGKIMKRLSLSGVGLLLPGNVRVLWGEIKEGLDLPGLSSLEARVFTRKGNRRMLLDRMSVPYPAEGGEEKREKTRAAE